MDFDAVVIIANSKDFDDALQNLKDAGYGVEIIVSKEEEK